MATPLENKNVHKRFWLSPLRLLSISLLLYGLGLGFAPDTGGLKGIQGFFGVVFCVLALLPLPVDFLLRQLPLTPLGYRAAQLFFTALGIYLWYAFFRD